MSLDSFIKSIQDVHSPIKAVKPSYVADGESILRSATQGLGYWPQFASGKISQTRKNILLHRLSLQAQVSMIGLATKFSSGKQILSSWVAAFALKLKAYFVAGGMASLGVIGIDPDDLKVVDDLSSRQMTFLAKFRDQIKSGDVDATVAGPDGKLIPSPGFLNRSGQYGLAVWSVGQNTTRQNRIRTGFRREQRVVASLEGTCQVCIDEWKKGWVKIGTLKELGDSPCGCRCRCRFIFQK